MHRTCHLVLFAVCLSFALSNTVNAQKKMAWKFEKGQQRESEIVQQITQVVNGESLGSVATLYVSTLIDDVEADGSAIVTKTITRAAMAIALPGGDKIEYDSAAGEAQEGTVKMFSDALAPLIGRQVQMKVGTNGHASDIKQLNAPTPNKKPASLFSPMVRGGQFEQLLAKSFLVFPEHQLVDSGKWKVSGTSALPLGKASLTSETAYTYRGTQEENGQVLDRFDAQTTLTIQQPTTEGSPPDTSAAPAFKISEQRSSGELLFDSQNSILVRSKVENVLTLAFATATGEVKQNLTFVTSQSSTIVEPVAPAEDQTVDVGNVEPISE